MQLEDHIQLLHNAPLFNGLGYEHLSLLAFSSEKLFFHEGESVTRDGLPGQAAYLILNGSVQWQEKPTGQHPVVRTLGKGGVIGELAMLIEYKYNQTVVARENTEVMQLTREIVHQLMTQFPDIAEHFSNKIHLRLMSIAEGLEPTPELSTKNIMHLS